MTRDETLLSGRVHQGCVDAGYTNTAAIIEARAAVGAWRQRLDSDKPCTPRQFADDWLDHLGIDVD